MKTILQRSIAAAAVTALFGANLAFAQAAAPQAANQLPQSAAAPAPRLGVSYIGAPKITPGARNIVGAVVFDASLSSSAIAVRAVPVSAAFMNAPLGTLTECAIAPVNSLNTPLTTGQGAVPRMGPLNTFTFDQPLTIPAGKSGQFALECIVNPAPIGGTVTVSVTPQNVLAYDAATGARIMPTVILNACGSAECSGLSTVGTQPQKAPGVPNTGAGGNAAESALALGISGAVALLGASYFLLPRRQNA